MRTRRRELDVDQLARLLGGDQAERDLRRYYGVGLTPTSGQLPAFEGGRFESLDGGGDRVDVCDRFTASDLLAVELLSVEVTPRVILDLLEGALGEKATELLREIPTSLPLWSEDAEGLIKKGGPADSLWRLLDHGRRGGGVTAGKLLARKRPALNPVSRRRRALRVGVAERLLDGIARRTPANNGQLRADIERLMSKLRFRLQSRRSADWMSPYGCTTAHPTPATGAAASLNQRSAHALVGASNEVFNLRGGGGPATAHKRLLAYLEWTSNAVRMLGYLVSPADLDSLVLTERYKLLLSGVGIMTSTEMEVQRVVNGLVSLELDERVETFEAAIKALDQRIKLWSEYGHYVIPDTSFYIEHKDKLEKVEFGPLIDVWQSPVTVLVPIVIVDELDRLKESTKGTVRWRAGYTLGVLDRVFAKSTGPRAASGRRSRAGSGRTDA